MRILGVGECNGLGDMYWRLGRAGHEVRAYVSEPASHDILHGMVTRCDDWRRELDWIRGAGDDGIVVFETATQGEIQDELRRDGFHVIGGSATGNRLELDRGFGQQALRDAGLQTATVRDFSDFDEARAFVTARPRRYVYKVNDPKAGSARNYVGEMDDGADVRAVLDMEQRRCPAGRRANFVLMDRVIGVEVGVGAYFNGHAFLAPAVLDWEHKRFFPGDLGELTGEMGTLVTYRGYERLFERTLARMADFLRAARYCGYINLNTIVNADGIWPLEFTCRFGYPGFAICDALHLDGWDSILGAMAHGRSELIRTHPGYAVGVVLTVPPFPHEYGYAELSRAAPVFLREGLSDAEREMLHFGEVGLKDGQLVCAGTQGYLMVATGRGADVRIAQAAAYRLAAQVVAPNLRYRNDIAERFLREDYATLQLLGYMD
ncbi:MAG TPA: phosphoribosylamine--glycine ligase [Verrucomicrobiae bacterium]|nr:phosphoribosylamine--glycine ligase [Verrucomicrobiae bacterium]